MNAIRIRLLLKQFVSTAPIHQSSPHASNVGSRAAAVPRHFPNCLAVTMLDTWTGLQCEVLGMENISWRWNRQRTNGSIWKRGRDCRDISSPKIFETLRRRSAPRHCVPDSCAFLTSVNQRRFVAAPLSQDEERQRLPLAPVLLCAYPWLSRAMARGV